MKVTNTTAYPTAALRVLLRFVATELEIGEYVRTVEITNYKGQFRGTCWGRRILIRIGTPDKFPLPVQQYRKRSPAYALADWLEVFVAIAGHEFQHGRQYRADRVAGRVSMHSEVDAERGAFRCLTAFRERRAELEAEIETATARESVREREKTATAAARKTPEARASARLEAARAKLAQWETKRKRAETAVTKWGKKVRRFELAAAKREAPATLPTREVYAHAFKLGTLDAPRPPMVTSASWLSPGTFGIVNHDGSGKLFEIGTDGEPVEVIPVRAASHAARK